MEQQKKVGTIRVATNSVLYADDAEIKKMPLCYATITDEILSSRGTKVQRHQYYASVSFDYLLKRRVNLTSDQYGLIVLNQGKAYEPHQFMIRVPARIVRTDFAAADDRKAGSAYAFETVLCPEVKIHERIDENDPYIQLYLKLMCSSPRQVGVGTDKKWFSFSEEYAPFIRTPKADEKIEDEPTALDPKTED